jgi:hypothetical protein
MNRLKSLRLVLLVLIIVSCNSITNKKATIETDENGVAILSNEQIEDIEPFARKQSFSNSRFFNDFLIVI